MAVVRMDFNQMWAQYWDGSHSVSTTVQVDNHAAVAEIALHSTWAAGESHHASDAFITQIVSASGVENFPSENREGGDLVAVVYRKNVTSVTFKVSVYQSKAHARWIVSYWA